MTKSKSKTKGLFKGVALGFALVLCSAFFPVNAIARAERNFVGETESQENTHRISVDGAVEENDSSATVIRGDDFTIPQGVYYNGTSPEGHVIGTTVSSTITVSKVDVIYKGTSERVIETITGLSSFTDQTFTATSRGTYIIRYTVIDNGVEYTYDFNVQCTISEEVSFEFRGNDANIIPSHYDKAYANSKNIVLPLPNVNDEDGDTVLSSETSENYVIDLDSRPTYTPDGENSFVYISLTGGSMDEGGNYNVKIKKNEDTGEFYIDGADLANIDSGSEFTITYYFYEIRENGNISYINSTTRTFTVHDDYYHTTSNGDAGYTLNASFSTTPPDSAIVGVEVDLPTVTGTTSASNSPSSEAVDVYYSLQVMKMDDNDRYTIDVTSEVYDEIENTFKAVEEGSYRFIYTVKDFYGNTASTSSTTFTITDVEDTQQATPIMYDAGEVELDEDGNYLDISYKLKSQTVNRNIIMYAITGTDNMVADEDITLKRVIRDATTTRFEITEYNDKNLIFAPGVASGQDSTMANIYTQILADNFDIYRQMAIDKLSDDRIDLDDPNKIRDWLIANNYRIVTTNWNQDPTGANILNKGDIGYSTTVGDQTAKDKMADKGFAFLQSTSSGGQYPFSARTYYFDYYADDNTGNNSERREVYRIITQESVSDTAAPTIDFSSDLQTAYLPTDTITFNTATASDTIDNSNRTSSVKVVTAYRFLNGDNTPVSNDAIKTNKTLQFVVNDDVVTSGGSQISWIEESKNATTGLVTSEGWFFDTSLTEYSIDLRNAPSDAETLEIFAYAVDDYGNIAFFSRKITIVNTADDDMPVLVNVKNAPDATAEEQTYLAGDKEGITLPTLEYKDSRPEYMSAEVTIYRVTTSGDEKQLIQNYNTSTDVDTYKGMFIVNGGKFTASVDGTYQVIVTVTDASNRALSTYFSYYVENLDLIETPTISNIASTTVDIQANTPYYLESPKLTITDSKFFGYIGLDETEDSNTSTYYIVSAVSATHSDGYELTQNWFTGVRKGTYKLQYTVFLMRYRADRLLEEGISSAEAGIYLEDGKLKYKEAGASSTSYYIYFERNYDEEGNLVGYTPTMNTSLDGSGTALVVPEGQTMQEAVEEKVGDLVKFFAPQSEIQTLTVSEVGINIYIDSSAYEKNQYPTINEDDPNLVTIVRPEIEIIGKGGINEEDSQVIINCTSDGSTTPIATISFAEWESAIADNSKNFVVEGETIKLKLIRNGTYTIRYEVQGSDGYANVGEPRVLEYTITNGDVIKPTIKLNQEIFKDTYKVGETLKINPNDIMASDNITSKEDLLSKLNILITNTDTNKSEQIINNNGDKNSLYEYLLKETGNYTVSITAKDKAGNTSEPVTFSFEVIEPILTLDAEIGFLNQEKYFEGDSLVLNEEKLRITDNDGVEYSITSLNIELYNFNTQQTSILTKVDGAYSFRFENEGQYELSVNAKSGNFSTTLTLNLNVEKTISIKFNIDEKISSQILSLQVNGEEYSGEDFFIKENDTRVNLYIKFKENNDIDIEDFLDYIRNLNGTIVEVVKNQEYEITLDLTNINSDLSFDVTRNQHTANLEDILYLVIIILLLIIIIVPTLVKTINKKHRK